MKKLVVITGASQGIGACLTLALAARGLSVIAIARQNDLLEKLKSHYPDKISIIAADLSNEIGRTKVITEVSKHSNINYLVHNAGIITPIGPMAGLSEQSIYEMFEVNLMTPLFLTTRLLPQMSKKSRILNITSVAGQQAVPGVGAYCISKAGLNMLTLIQQKELQEYGIISTRVIPGEVDTALQKDLRDASVIDFPLATEFQQAKEFHALIPPEICASFMSWLLLETSEDEYPAQEWNIYDKAHHQFWLKEVLPLPLNKQKLATVTSN